MIFEVGSITKLDEYIGSENDIHPKFNLCSWICDFLWHEWDSYLDNIDFSLFSHIYMVTFVLFCYRLAMDKDKKNKIH